MSTTGVLGQPWRADVTQTGSVVPWDGSPVLDWYVAADDRWHDPKTDTGVRHSRLDGSAVYETRLRIPGGDVVQRVWSVADRGGFTLVEVHNESSLPVAVAFTRSDVVTSRPPTDVPIMGIDLPAGTVVLPIGHRTTVVVGIAHGSKRPESLPSGLPRPDAVARGWISRTDSASRLELPEPALVESVRAARCEVLLGGAGDVDDDPEEFLVAIGELVRMGELGGVEAGCLAPDIAKAVARTAAGTSVLRAAALGAAGVVLAAAGERRALRDLRRLITEDGAVDDMECAGIAAVPAVERRLVAGARLFPAGIPRPWLGADFEAHGLVGGPSSRLSLAVRWHGPNAAVLWEVTGDPVTLTSTVPQGGWSTDDPRGETLWVLVGS